MELALKIKKMLFTELKEAIRLATTLSFYDIYKPVVGSVDVNSYVMGAATLEEGRFITF